MNIPLEYTDDEGRVFYYEQGARIYVDGGKDSGVPVPFTPTLKDEPEEFSWRQLQLVQAIQNAGFVVEEIQSSDGLFRLACTSAAGTHCFWIGLRPFCWFIGSWAGRFYRGLGLGRLQELCLLLLRNPPGGTTDFQGRTESPIPKIIQQQFALEELACAGGGLERALGPSLQPCANLLRERFGFRPYLVSEEDCRPELCRAWAARNRHLGQLVVPLEPERVLVNNELICIPYPYFTIGGPGEFLFERRTGRGLSVHHPFTAGTLVWAYYHGFGWPAERRRGTVTIKAVHDLKLALSILGSTRPSPSPVFLELRRRLSSPPFTLRDVDLDLELARRLFRAQEDGCGGCIEFGVTPDDRPTPEARGSAFENSLPPVN